MVQNRQKKVLLLALAGYYVARRKRFGLHPLFAKRRQYGEYYTTFLEMKSNINEEPYQEKFYEYTRMTWSCFSKLLSLIRERLFVFFAYIIQSFILRICRIKKDRRGGSISPAEQLVVCLRFLATGVSYRAMSFPFRIPHNTISLIVKRVCNAIWEILSPIYMKTPSTQLEWWDISDGFFQRWQAPNTIGYRNLRKKIVDSIHKFEIF